MKQGERNPIPGAIVRSDAAPPLHRQIYQALRETILKGRLAPGARLPSSRALAAMLGTSRSTVVSAVDQLVAEGFLEARTGSGTFVAQGIGPQPTAVVAALGSDALSHRAQALIKLPPLNFSRIGPPRAFRTGQPATEQFPMREWSESALRAWRALPQTALDYPDPLGYLPLREAIAEHLGIVRGVHTDPEQVMIVAGSQQALEFAARAVSDPGDEAWVEDPGYLGARRAFMAAGLVPRPVPVDAEGIDLAYAQTHHPAARLVHVTPSHQFPLGVSMSLRRRLALVAWAKAHSAWILEDDYDSEFRYSGHPLTPLQALDDTGRVIYIGTFSKVLFPGLRLGYMVVPKGLTEAFRTMRGFLDRGMPPMLQAATAVFMREGRYQSHIRRMRALYAERRAALVEILAAELGDRLKSHPPDAGMHLIASVQDGTSDVRLAEAALQLGVYTQALSTLAELPIGEGALLLGFSGVTHEEMVDGAQKLRQAFDCV